MSSKASSTLTVTITLNDELGNDWDNVKDFVLDQISNLECVEEVDVKKE